MSTNEENPIWKFQEGTTTMFIAEIVGTGMLIFIGCMGCIGTMSSTLPPPLQTSITFGMTVNLIIMMLGHISGAHLNPAVTIGATIVGLKTIPTAVMYVVGQFIGATIGYWILMSITPPELFNDGQAGSTVPLCVTVVHPKITTVQAVLIEILCTACVLCAACATWDPRCAHTTDSTALRFGFSVVAISLAAAPYTGCSMNPARSFGPAFWNSAWKDQWLYWFGPSVGALLGTYTYQVLFLEKQATEKISDLPSVEMKLLNSTTDYVHQEVMDVNI